MKKLTSFGLLNIIQFLAAINENLYKLLVAFFLISEYGERHTSTIMAIIGVLFILPFLLFSSLGGIFADIKPKSQITRITRFLEFCCLILALFIFGFHLSFGAYVILFLMASLSAIFGPSKYGIIPELIDSSRILYANSVIAAFTFLGIIIGTTLASFVVWLTSANYVLALSVSVVIALSGAILSLFLPKTPIGNKDKPIRFFIYIELWDALKQMWTIPSLIKATFAYSYFLFVGGFIQLNIIPYTVQTLGFSDIIGGYFFLATALGLGFGAFFTDRISHGRIRLGMIPLAGMGISLVLILMKWFYTPWALVVTWMVLLGFLGGIFLVPAQAFVLSASPETDRGRNFATANFFSFVFALLAAIALYLLNTM
ncbi:MAG: hypothetical protein K1000chlam2_01801, partial [Chlamydiae bacterium]|nr:hypothetical protein [Chlamydiota bacterium]